MATFDGLFDPAKVAEKRRLDSEKREALARIKAWAEEPLPEPARGRLKVTVNEVVCGDPACAPIDTVVEFWGELRTGFGMPSRAAEVTHADLVSFLPDEDVLVAWARGFDAEWPKPAPPPAMKPEFSPGDDVEAWLGGQWQPAVVTSVWHREKGWPLDAYVPYRVDVVDTMRTCYAPTVSHVRARRRSRSRSRSQAASSSPS